MEAVCRGWVVSELRHRREVEKGSRKGNPLVLENGSEVVFTLKTRALKSIP